MSGPVAPEQALGWFGVQRTALGDVCSMHAPAGYKSQVNVPGFRARKNAKARARKREQLRMRQQSESDVNID